MMGLNDERKELFSYQVDLVPGLGQRSLRV